MLERPATASGGHGRNEPNLERDPMIRSSILAAAAALTTLAAAPAFADDIDATRLRQQERIQQGRTSGQLTRHEYYELEREQARIGALIHRARLDGRMDPYERREIVAAQEEASRHIWREKHDGEARGFRPWYRRWY